ncbi:uncharacterized protein F4822DRAFT_397246 [Hypoxylon trugodes]|uniref:uncharacterized protein n=1 Tax=Hypoxylon trugodes TaxID=326681 RepID=UPI002193AB26|nr:uncharacterized protein F4822DRAFT_397246 [Hypoxylon trugodes]KAI1391602.1 hypothetical protein F4822DRAFT_397246 [Hypoxylon trugodes]
MDFVRQISRQSAINYGKVKDVSPSTIQVLRVTPQASSPDSDLNFSIKNFDGADLFNQIHHDQLFPKPSPKQPSLNMVFFSSVRWKDEHITNQDRIKLFEYLRLDDALLAYLLSSRTGWYYVAGDNQYSFMIKDYMYMLAWTFDPATLETRAMLAARSDYAKRSSLKSDDGNFHLPGFSTAHLYHPLSLACLCLADFASYFERVIVEEGYVIGDIEKDTGHGVWKKDHTETDVFELGQLMTASRNIAKNIGIFANLFKSIEITPTIAEALQDKIWRDWYKKYRNDEESLEYFDKCSASFVSAAGLLKQRINAIKQSARGFDERTKAQSNVIAALMRREDARVGHQLAEASKKLAEATKKDSSDMKVIAIMTMAFLPATFFAALFDLPTLDWNQPIVITRDFWVYWAFTVPTTLLVFVMWDILNDQKIFCWLKSISNNSKTTKEAPKDSSENSMELVRWRNDPM